MWISFFILTIIVLLLWGYTMSAIDNLNQAVIDLQATINSLVIPTNNDIAIQVAADNITAANAALKAKIV